MMLTLPFNFSRFALALGFTLIVPVQAGVFESIGEEVNALFEKARPAIVKIRAGTDGLSPSGTGFFIDSNGTLLTAAAIIGEATTAEVEYNGLDLEARVIARDLRTRMALLHVSAADTPHLNFGKSSDLKTGYGVVAIGYPLDLPSAPASGLVSGFDIRCLNFFFPTTHIHANVSISPGEIGGPLLNTNGQVIGLIVNTPDEGRSIYALPSEAINKILTDFNQYGQARHGWAGVIVEEDLKARNGRTVLVSKLVPTTPAYSSGIQPGDTVMRIDSREIYRPADVVDAAFFSHVGGTMNVVVLRSDKLLTYNFPVIERPPDPTALKSQASVSSGSKVIQASDKP